MSIKVLYYGGQKSGKSLLAEERTLSLSSTHTDPKKMPYYLATYDNSYADKEMQKRLDRHKQQRQDKFISIEEPKDLTKYIKVNESYLIDCISMWIFNNIEQKEELLLSQLEKLSQLNTNIVFVLNDVNSGIIPMDRESRKFVDRTGTVGQYLAKICDEVYEVKLGLPIRLK